MPTYSYSCGKCGHQFDVFHGMSETPKLKCEACGSTRLTRLIGTGGGIIFKGGGFYETDFKEKKGAPPKESAPAKEGAAAEKKEATAKSGEKAAGTEKPKKEAAAKPAKAAEK